MKQIAQSLWDEWAYAPIHSSEEGSAEATGILSSLDRTSAGYVTTRRLFVVRRLHLIWKTVMGDDASFGPFLEIPKRFRGKVTIRLSDERFFGASTDTLNDENSTRWMKGAFGGCGSLFIPRVGYYMAFRCVSFPVSDRIEHMLREWGYSFSKRTRGSSCEILLRDQQNIVSFLAKIQLLRSSFALEDLAIFRSMREKANKLVNCDAYNIKKSLDTAQKQIKYAFFIKQSGMYATLPHSLKEVLDLRLANPSASLSELGALLSPEVSKSTVLYRWKKLRNLYPFEG